MLHVQATKGFLKIIIAAQNLLILSEGLVFTTLFLQTYLVEIFLKV